MKRNIAVSLLWDHIFFLICRKCKRLRINPFFLSVNVCGMLHFLYVKWSPNNSYHSYLNTLKWKSFLSSTKLTSILGICSNCLHELQARAVTCIYKILNSSEWLRICSYFRYSDSTFLFSVNVIVLLFPRPMLSSYAQFNMQGEGKHRCLHVISCHVQGTLLCSGPLNR